MERDAAGCAQTQTDQSSGQTPGFDLATFDLGRPNTSIHFIGLGGIGMSALARLLLAQGRAVSGSDQSESEIIRELARLGARTFIGHAAANVRDAGAVVVSTAISSANPELVQARELNLPIVHRSDLLKELSKPYKMIAVSGTHGKTTTTGMVSQVLIDCGFDPCVVVGGIFAKIGSNGRYGKGEYFVAEADESDRTHCDFASYMSVITNIEADHLENYPGGLKQIQDVMVSFANKSKHAVVICQDDPGCRTIMPEITTSKITYGKRSAVHAAQYQYESLEGGGMRVFKGEEPLGQLTLSVLGEHNKQNALSAIAVAMELGGQFEAIARSLESFAGVNRRFQLLGEARGVAVVDDYAHHPTEVVATLQAAQQYVQDPSSKLKRVVALFQPHQPGRLRDFWQDFLAAFDKADLVLLADVYIARGAAIEGISSDKLVAAMKHADAHYLGGPTAQLAEKLKPYLRSGDLVLTIGAGDVTKVGPQLLKVLAQGS